MTGIVVAATDTDVGKTWVTASVVCWLRAQGLDAVPMKPVQTGALEQPDGSWRAPDLDFVLDGAGLQPGAATYRKMAPACFAAAASPHLAARLEGRSVAGAAIRAAREQLAKQHACVVAEGAGGLLVPLSDNGPFLVDLLAEPGWPVLLVGRAGLGTINHTLLSLEALQARGATVLGSVLVQPPDEAAPDWLLADNAATLERLAPAPFLGLFGPVAGATAADLTAAVATSPRLADALAPYAAAAPTPSGDANDRP